jgi:hypothetical protein
LRFDGHSSLPGGVADTRPRCLGRRPRRGRDDVFACFKTPFHGLEAAVELFGVLFDSLGDLEFTDEFAAGDAHAFFWRADAGGRWVEGADLLRSDEHGKITEIRVLIRPLVGIAAFAGAIGPPLAAKRGEARAVLLRLLTLPLKAIMALTDAFAWRLVRPR